MTSTPGDLPEVQASVEAVEDVRRANHRVVRNITAIAVLVAAFFIGNGLWNDHETSLIRDTQVQNTKRSNCQDRAFDDILRDVHSAILQDKDPADYPVPTKKC